MKKKKEKRLAKEIRLLGYSQKEVSGLLGITEMTVSNWINDNSTISPVMVRKLKEIGIPIEAIRNPSESV